MAEETEKLEWWETFDGILGKMKELRDENITLKKKVKGLERKLKKCEKGSTIEK